jgi:hypothetical protein
MFLSVHIQHLGKHIRIYRSICSIGTMMQPFSYGITQNLAENHNLLVSHMFEERVSRASPQILMEFDGIGFSYKLLRST